MQRARTPSPHREQNGQDDIGLDDRSVAMHMALEGIGDDSRRRTPLKHEDDSTTNSNSPPSQIVITVEMWRNVAYVVFVLIFVSSILIDKIHHTSEGHHLVPQGEDNPLHAAYGCANALKNRPRTNVGLVRVLRDAGGHAANDYAAAVCVHCVWPAGRSTCVLTST